MENVKLTINGKEITAPVGSTILEAARRNGIYIPTLCYDEAVAGLRRRVYQSFFAPARLRSAMVW